MCEYDNFLSYSLQHYKEIYDIVVINPPVMPNLQKFQKKKSETHKKNPDSSYLIHDNGGRPLRLLLILKRITIPMLTFIKLFMA